MADARPLRTPRTPTAYEVADHPWLYSGQQIVAALRDMRKQRDAARARPQPAPVEQMQGCMERLAEAWRQQEEAGR